MQRIISSIAALVTLCLSLSAFAIDLGGVGRDIGRGVERGAADAVKGALGIGSHLQVEWKGGWYPATILKTRGDQYYIHYDGYSSSWDEWVGRNRIR